MCGESCSSGSDTASLGGVEGGATKRMFPVPSEPPKLITQIILSVFHSILWLLRIIQHYTYMYILYIYIKYYMYVYIYTHIRVHMYIRLFKQIEK